jgi:hypothetical protein
MCFREESAGKPDPVPAAGHPAAGGDHLSGTPVSRRLGAAHLGRSGRAVLSLLGLAPGGACLATTVTRRAGELLPHRFTLTHAAPRDAGGRSALCCAFRVSPRLGVTQHPALWSPDFPHAHRERRDARPPGRLLPGPPGYRRVRATGWSVPEPHGSGAGSGCLPISQPGPWTWRGRRSGARRWPPRPPSDRRPRR